MIARLRDHGALECKMMQRRSGNAMRKIEADADLGSARNGKGHGVTEDLLACGDGG
jgi:hypothetical protein